MTLVTAASVPRWQSSSSPVGKGGSVIVHTTLGHTLLEEVNAALTGAVMHIPTITEISSNS